MLKGSRRCQRRATSGQARDGHLNKITFNQWLTYNWNTSAAYLKFLHDERRILYRNFK